MVRPVFPQLVTERLLLEPFAPRHSAGLFALWSQPEVCLHSGEALDRKGHPIRLPAESPADSDGILEFFIGRARKGSGVRWAVLRRLDGGFVGAVGWNAFEPCAELAYHLHPDAWGAGYAREACQAVIGWLRESHAGTPIEAFIEPGNVRSVALARKLGFVATADATDGALRHRLEAPT